MSSEPPDPGGGRWGTSPGSSAPPSPGAFISVGSAKTKSLKRLRVRVGTESSDEEATHTSGWTTPTNSFSPIRVLPATPAYSHPNNGDSQSVSLPLGQNNSVSVPMSAGTVPLGQKVVTPVARQSYTSNDLGPFVVHVQRIDSMSTPGLFLHPVAFGRFIAKRTSEYKGVIDGSLKKIGRNRVSLSFTSYDTANLFIESPSLVNNGYKAFIPSYNVSRLGLVRGIPTDMSEIEIMREAQVPKQCGPILKVRRLNFKSVADGTVTWKPSETVVLTFDGQVLPPKIFLCYNAFSVEQYILPTIQCFKCCRYGHTKLQCRSSPACFKCAEAHLGESCSVSPDYAKCIWCKGCHFATNKACPELSRQLAIKRYMSQNLLSYSEASRLHPHSKISYAEVAASPAPPPSQFRSTGPLIDRIEEPSKIHYRGSKKSKGISSTPVGYDRVAHAGIIRGDFSEAAPNGCALNADKSSVPSVQSVISELLKLLNLLSSLLNPSSSPQPPVSSSPSNAAFDLHSLVSLLRNGSQVSAVEL